MAIEIVDFPIKNGGSFHSYVKLPEGNHYWPLLTMLFWDVTRSLFWETHLLTGERLVFLVES